jgi:hypothetical protein
VEYQVCSVSSLFHQIQQFFQKAREVNPKIWKAMLNVRKNYNALHKKFLMIQSSQGCIFVVKNLSHLLYDNGSPNEVHRI